MQRLGRGSPEPLFSCQPIAIDYKAALHTNLGSRAVSSTLMQRGAISEGTPHPRQGQACRPLVTFEGSVVVPVVKVGHVTVCVHEPFVTVEVSVSR